MKIENFDFITILTITLITECLFLFSFRYTKLPFSGPNINRWYDKFGLIAILMDILIIAIGFYLAKYLYIYLKNKNIIKENNNNINLIYFLVIILLIQILHDSLFYFLVIKPYKKGTNNMIDEFKIYAKNVKAGAIIGDSSMYILSILILYLIQNYNNDLKILLTLISSYLIGYFMYQEPIAK